MIAWRLVRGQPRSLVNDDSERSHHRHLSSHLHLLHLSTIVPRRALFVPPIFSSHLGFLTPPFSRYPQASALFSFSKAIIALPFLSNITRLPLMCVGWHLWPRSWPSCNRS